MEVRNDQKPESYRKLMQELQRKDEEWLESQSQVNTVDIGQNRPGQNGQ